MRTLFILLLGCFSCLAQFGVEQPMFQLTSTGGYPAENLLLFWSKSDFGGSNDVYGTTLTNGATVDHWYYKTSAIPALLRLDSSGAGTDPTYYTNGPAGYPYFRLLGGANSYLSGQPVAGIGDVTRPTMFIVCRIPEYGGITRWNTTGGSAIWSYLSGNNPFPTLTVWNNGTGIDALAPIATNTWILLTLGLRDPNQALARINGETVMTNSCTAGLKLTYDGNFAVGYASVSGANKLMDVVEIRAYTNGLATADMMTIETLLMSKYGLSNKSGSSVAQSTLLSYDIDALGLSDGDPISSVTDSGPYGYTLTSSGGARPYWTNSVAMINDEGCAYYDGSNKTLTNRFTETFPQPTHVFYVGNHGSVAADSIGWYLSGEGTTFQGVYEYNNEGFERVYGGTDQISGSAYAHDWKIWEVLFQEGGALIRTNNAVYKYGYVGTSPVKSIYMGGSFNPSSGKGWIAYMLVCTNKIDSVSASNLVQSLGTRYGITTYTRN